MRQQSGFLQYPPGDMGNVFQSRFKAHFIQCLAGRVMTKFGFLTQGEQGFLATHRLSLPGDGNSRFG